MLHTLILGSFRIGAFLIVTSPIILNFVYRGDVINSLLYVPLLMLVLGFTAAYFDQKLEAMVIKVQKKSSLNQSIYKPNRSHHRNAVCKYLEHLRIA